MQNHRRVSSPGFLAVTALALSTALPAAAVPVSFEVIDDNPPTDPWMKSAGDIDKNGRIDIVVAGRSGPVVWYRAPQWDRHTIASQVSPAGSSTDIGLFDLDADGDLDAVLANGMWHENPLPGGNPATQTWAARVYGGRYGHDVIASDLDRDGDLDLVTRHQGAPGELIYVYRNDPGDSWLEISIDPVPKGEGLAVGDLDGDGDADIAITDRWYENNGPLATGAWQERLFDGVVSAEPDAVVVATDLNLDGRTDLVVTPAEKVGQSGVIYWYRAPSSPRTQPWLRQSLSSSVPSSHHSLQVLDWDLDGDLDLATARMHDDPNPIVEVLRNNGTGRCGPSRSWTASAATTCRPQTSMETGMWICSAPTSTAAALRTAHRCGSGAAVWCPSPGSCPRWSPAWSSWRGCARERGDAEKADRDAAQADERATA